MATILQPTEEQEENKSQQTTLPTSGGIISGKEVPSSGTIASSSKPKGSGRFTNLQKYLSANKQGGQQVASKIGQNIKGSLDKQKQQSQEYYSQINQGIQQAKDVAQAGGQFIKELGNIHQNILGASGAENYDNRGQDLGVQSFVQQPNFGQFQDIQSGRGIDERLLQARQANLAKAASGFLGESTKNLQQLSNEGGRFDLLKSAFGGNINPQYSAGQQRLDQLFLAREGLQPLQEDVRQEVRSGRELQKLASQSGADVDRLVGQERTLISDIGKQAAANEQAFIDMLSSFVPEINKRRAKEWNELERAIDDYAPINPDIISKQGHGQGLTPEQLRRLGVDRQHRTYNVLSNLDGAHDIAIRGRDASGYQDVVGAGDLAKYNALAKIAQIGEDSLRIKEESNLGDSYMAQTDKGKSLTDRFLTADEMFRREAEAKRLRRGMGNEGGFKGTVGIDTTVKDILSGGSDALNRDTIIRGNNPNIERQKRAQQDQVMKEFKEFLAEQGYNNFIGGKKLKGEDRGTIYDQEPITPGRSPKFGSK